MNWKWTKEQGQDYLTCELASRQLRYAAIWKGKVVQFAHAMDEPEMQVKELTEWRVQGKLIPPKIKLTEMGRAIQLKQDYVLPQSFDLQDPVQKRLVWQATNTLDHCSLAALKDGSRVAGVNTSVSILKSVVKGVKWTGIEALCSTISGYMCSCAEPYDRTYYVGIGGIRFLRAMKRHPKFLPWQKYLNKGDVLFVGEEGSTNNIRWIRLSDTSLLKNEGVVFGHRGLLLKEIQTPHLRAYEGAIAWHGLLTLGSQNVLHVPERKRRWA